MAQFVSVQHRGITKKLALCTGIPPKEINQNIKAAFNLISSCVGLEDGKAGIIYPLSLLSKDVTVFDPTTTFTLLLSFDPSLPHLEDEEEEKEEDESFNEDEGDEKDLEDSFYEQNRSADDQNEGDEYSDSGEYKEEGSEDEADQQRIHMLAYIQQNTGFSSVPMTEILEVFRTAAAETGVIDRPTFERCFTAVINKRPGKASQPTDKKVVKSIANHIFDVFDRDGNGYVDHAEFVAGLSLLCRASSDDKIQAAFSLFDLDGDGFISFPEMLRYMTSFFEVCFALDPSMKKRFGDTTAAQVGQATANHCFVRADANKDGQISFEEFKAWCNSDDSFARATVPQ
jgi:Ca2+-binding EF-hand superfamily protein